MVVAWIIVRAYRLVRRGVKKGGLSCPRERTVVTAQTGILPRKWAELAIIRPGRTVALGATEEIVMRPVFLAASLVVAAAFGSPDVSTAQEPKRSPKAAAAAEAATQPQTRDAAVPREVGAVRDVAPKTSPRTESSRGEASRLDPSANASASDDQQRRGAVRRPPSDGGRSGGGQSPRDRAVTRSGPPPRDYDRDRNDGYRDRVYYYPSYWSYGRYYDPYYSSGFHLGYLAYSPWGWTPAFYGNPYGYGYGQGFRGWDFGALRIKVRPRDAEVYVDGYFAGNVDDFDGMFQSLRLEIGGYKIEVRKPGYETLTFDVHVQPDRTITYRGDMRPTP
jgi:hypothetical protein